MSTALRVGVVVASAAVVIGTGVASWITHAPTTYGRGVTLTLSATGDSSTGITYTCGDNETTPCGGTVSPWGVWNERVTVPWGTTVRVQARGGVLSPTCSIADSSDRLVLDHEEDGMCEVVAGR